MSVIYSSRMETLDWFGYSDGVTVLKPLWGIDGGNAMTCCHSAIKRLAQPTYSTELHEGTIRWQYAFLHTSGTLVETKIIYFRVGSAFNVYWGAEYNSSLSFNIDGSISYYIDFVFTGSPHFVKFTSAPGVFTPNGTYHAFQFRFYFPSHNTVEFEVLINNVTVLNESFTTTYPPVACDDGIPTNPATYVSNWARLISSTGGTALCSNLVELAGINEVTLVNRVYAIHTRSSHVELIIDDSKAPVSYLPGNASRVKADTCSGGTPDPPPVKGGVYVITPSSLTHDRYYENIDKKIPDPRIRTGKFGE